MVKKIPKTKVFNGKTYHWDGTTFLTKARQTTERDALKERGFLVRACDFAVSPTMRKVSKRVKRIYVVYQRRTQKAGKMRTAKSMRQETEAMLRRIERTGNR